MLSLMLLQRVLSYAAIISELCVTDLDSFREFGGGIGVKGRKLLCKFHGVHPGPGGKLTPGMRRLKGIKTPSGVDSQCYFRLFCRTCALMTLASRVLNVLVLDVLVWDVLLLVLLVFRTETNLKLFSISVFGIETRGIVFNFVWQEKKRQLVILLGCYLCSTRYPALPNLRYDRSE
jgi:hypothetical protein